MQDFPFEILETLLAKKARLDAFGKLSPALTKNLWDWLRIELTYTSNALEGNTLSRQETALVVNEGLSVPGKEMVELMEAKNHDLALQLIERQSVEIPVSAYRQSDLLAVHAQILRGIDDANAGVYRSVPVRIRGSATVLPNYLKVPDLMDELEKRRQTAGAHPVALAVELHYQLVTIHPFVDGNGRTARLLFNYVLLSAGFPLCFIEKAERGRYLSALEKGQTGGSKRDYYEIMLGAATRSLDLYLEAVGAGTLLAASQTTAKLLKIGELARLTGETVPILRHRHGLGLLTAAASTSSGYFLFDEGAAEKIRYIRKLQREQRLSLPEIKKLLG